MMRRIPAIPWLPLLLGFVLGLSADCLRAQTNPFLALDRPRAETDPFLALVLGYSPAVNAVAVSPDGRQAISGGKDNFLRLWDIGTGLLLRTFDAQTSSINAVAFSPDGRQILTASNDKQLLLWDLTTGQAVRAMEGFTGEALGAQISPDGHKALSGGSDKTVRLWDLDTGLILKTFDGHTDSVQAVAFSPDGLRALSASKDKTVKLWNIETGEMLKTFEGHAGEVTSATFSSDGGKVLSAASDRTAKLWDAGSGQLLKTFEGHGDEVLFAALSSDDTKVLTASKDKTLKIWDAASGRLIRTFAGHTDEVTSVAFLPDGRRALSGSLDKTLKLWDVTTGEIQSTFDLRSEAFSPNGYRNFFRGASPAKTTDPVKLDARLKEKGFARGNPVFLRIFKADSQVELWMLRGSRFELFSTYPICAWSGQLGPKIKEGDSQSPEGYYTIGKGQLNPYSRFHRAFNLGFPNAFDRALNRTGSNVMMHGACASIGCYAMTDPVIDELWQIVTAALDAGQERAGVNVFPFRMTAERMAAFAWHPAAEFWRDLKPAYDLFEVTRIPPRIAICNGRYTVQRAQDAGPSAPALQSICGSNRGASLQPGALLRPNKAMPKDRASVAASPLGREPPRRDGGGARSPEARFTY